MNSAAWMPSLSVSPLPPDAPVPGLATRIIEMLRVRREDLVVDLDYRDLQQFRRALVESEANAPSRASSPSKPPNRFGEGLAFALITSGVRLVQMGPLTFGRFPMRYEKILLRDGLSHFAGDLRALLAEVFRRLDPAALLLVVDRARSADAPLFSAGLRRWERWHPSPGLLVDRMREAGFQARADTVEFPRQATPAECLGWVEARGWPHLDSLSREDLELGLCELRARHESKQIVEFTSRFDLVLGRKPEASAV